MAEKFDPYHKWLGISPQNQPPDLYRLLAIERFERDVEVIEAAANRQMAYIQSCATGPYVEHSQELLNEIAAARLCLLDVRRKAEYDAVLRDKLLARVRSASVATPVGRKAQSNVTGEGVSGAGRNLETAIEKENDVQSPRVVVPPPAPPRPKPPRPSASPTIVAGARSEPSGKSARRAARKPAMPLRVVLVLGLFAVLAVGAAVYMVSTAGDRDGVTLAGTGLRQNGEPPLAAQPTGIEQNPHNFPPLAVNQSSAAEDGSTIPPRASAGKVAHEIDALFRTAEVALADGDAEGALHALLPVAIDTSASRQLDAQRLIVQIKKATSEKWAYQTLINMDSGLLARLEEGKLPVNDPNFPTDEFKNPDCPNALLRIADKMLSQVLPQVKGKRRLGPPPPDGVVRPGVEPPTGVVSESVAPPPVDPTELLKARNLRRVMGKWIPVDEDRCIKLVENAKEAVKRQKELSQELIAAERNRRRAEPVMERDKRVLHRAKETGMPADQTPEFLKLEEHATASQNAFNEAKAEVVRLRNEKAAAEKQENDARQEARRLAEALDDQYRRLAADAQIKETLDQLKQSLGPTEEFKALRTELYR